MATSCLQALADLPDVVVKQMYQRLSSKTVTVVTSYVVYRVPDTLVSSLKLAPSRFLSPLILRLPSESLTGCLAKIQVPLGSNPSSATYCFCKVSEPQFSHL